MNQGISRNIQSRHLECSQRTGIGYLSDVTWRIWMLLIVFSAFLMSTSPRAVAADWDTPRTRMLPIDPPASSLPTGAHSAAAQRQSVSANSGGSAAETRRAGTIQTVADDGFQPAGTIRQTVMMQAAAQPFAMPAEGPSGYPGPSGIAAPPSLPAPLSSVPQLGPVAPSLESGNDPLPRPPLGSVTAPSVSPQPLPRTNATPPSTSPISSPITAAPSTIPGTLSPVPRAVGPSQPLHSSTDYAPLAQPRLEQHFATLSNCRNVSAPSGYRSDRILTCGPPPTMITTVGATAPPSVYLPPPAQIGPPIVVPPAALPATPLAAGPAVVPGPAGHRPLISFGQEQYPVQIGQGIFGQPTAYVPGQTFRNAIRYLTW